MSLMLRAGMGIKFSSKFVFTCSHLLKCLSIFECVCIHEQQIHKCMYINIFFASNVVDTFLDFIYTFFLNVHYKALFFLYLLQFLQSR